MAHASHDGSSSSSSSLINMSSSLSQSSTTLNIVEDIMNDNRYRRKEVIDGNVVRVFESVRRRRGESVPGPTAINHGAQVSPNQHYGYATNCTEVADRSAVVVHAIQSSPKSSMSDPTLQHSAGKGSTASRREVLEISNDGDKVFIRHSSPLTPPPTPRIKRLPTPDLEPLKERQFCGCCSHSITSRHHGCFDSRNYSRTGLWW